YPLVIECPKALAAFDRPGAIARIRNIKSPILRFWKADTLVQLGDFQAIPMLIEELESEESAARTLAFRDLQHYTQEDIPYDPNASAPARKSAADAWRQWWRGVEGNFRVK